MALTTLASVNAALPGMKQEYVKAVAVTAGAWNSAWLLTGPPGTGVAPSSGVAGDVPTDATAGSFPFTNPSSGNTYLARLDGYAQAAGAGPTMLAVYDRLWHNSGISSTATTAQTIQASTPLVPLTRPDADGGSAEAWLEVYAAMGSGTPTVTLTYTDQSGNTGQSGSSGALVTTMAAGRTVPFQLAAGDTGVRSIQTWQASATFTSGTIGLVLRRCLTMLSLQVNTPSSFDALACGLPRVYDDACLELLWFSQSANTIGAAVQFALAQG